MTESALIWVAALLGVVCIICICAIVIHSWQTAPTDYEQEHLTPLDSPPSDWPNDAQQGARHGDSSR